MKNWKTSLFGSLAAILGAAATAETPYQHYFIAGAAICTALFAFFSKDGNVTGGSVQQ